jgi:hypothetical protein
VLVRRIETKMAKESLILVVSPARPAAPGRAILRFAVLDHRQKLEIKSAWMDSTHPGTKIDSLRYIERIPTGITGCFP